MVHVFIIKKKIEQYDKIDNKLGSQSTIYTGGEVNVRQLNPT